MDVVTRTKILISHFCVALFITYVGPASAGGPFTNGTSTRAQSMQNAYCAVADDASAVYYNPAGLTATLNAQLIASTLYVAPNINVSGSTGQEISAESDKAAAGFSLFGSYRLNDEWIIGAGLYAPVARVTEFAPSPITGNSPQRSKILQLDLATMLARRWGPISIGFGPVVSQTRYESEVLGFHENAEGNDLSFSAGILTELSETLKLGLTYRSETNSKIKGSGFIRDLARGNFDARQRIPSTFTVGLSWRGLQDQLILATDIEHQNWSRVQSFNRNYDNPILNSIATTSLGAKDAIAYRLGGEFSAEGRSFRGGYSFTEAAVGPQSIIPSQPDFDIHAISVGYGYRFSNVELNAGLEFQKMNTRLKQAPPFSGRYEMHVLSLLFGARYVF
jgi:long-chain fatty acid transport protein